MVDPEMQGLVIDNGGGNMKVGFSGDDAPRSVFPTVVGRTKSVGIIITEFDMRTFVGDEAIYNRGRLKLKYPIEHGMITNWNDMEKIWHQTYYIDCHVTPEEHPVLMTEAPLNPKNNREKIVSINFETFNVPALYVANQSVLAIYSVGRTIGIVLDSGYDVTHCVPIYEGLAVSHAIGRMNHGGSDITKFLSKLLSTRGYEMTTSSEMESVKDMKEKLGYMALDYDSEIEKANTSSKCEHEYELPDGSKMTIGDERFKAPEVLFKPSLIGSEAPGISDMLDFSINRCDKDLWRDLYPNIVLSGGSTLFEGIVERFTDEILKLAPKRERVKVNAPAERKFSCWIGGSILSSLSIMNDLWITKDEYDDAGATIVHRKCF